MLAAKFIGPLSKMLTRLLAKKADPRRGVLLPAGFASTRGELRSMLASELGVELVQETVPRVLAVYKLDPSILKAPHEAGPARHEADAYMKLVRFVKMKDIVPFEPQLWPDSHFEQLKLVPHMLMPLDGDGEINPTIDIIVKFEARPGDKFGEESESEETEESNEEEAGNGPELLQLEKIQIHTRVGGRGGDGFADDGDEVAAAGGASNYWLSSNVYVPGVDEQAITEANPVMLRMIQKQKKAQREQAAQQAKEQAEEKKAHGNWKTVADRHGQENSAKEASLADVGQLASGKKGIVRGGGLARLNLSSSRKAVALGGQDQVVKDMEAYLAGQAGVDVTESRARVNEAGGGRADAYADLTGSRRTLAERRTMGDLEGSFAQRRQERLSAQDSGSQATAPRLSRQQSFLEDRRMSLMAGQDSSGQLDLRQTRITFGDGTTMSKARRGSRAPVRERQRMTSSPVNADAEDGEARKEKIKGALAGILSQRESETERELSAGDGEDGAAASGEDRTAGGENLEKMPQPRSCFSKSAHFAAEAARAAAVVCQDGNVDSGAAVRAGTGAEPEGNDEGNVGSPLRRASLTPRRASLSRLDLAVAPGNLEHLAAQQQSRRTSALPSSVRRPSALPASARRPSALPPSVRRPSALPPSVRRPSALPPSVRRGPSALPASATAATAIGPAGRQLSRKLSKAIRLPAPADSVLGERRATLVASERPIAHPVSRV